jgi:hypothetical protein
MSLLAAEAPTLGRAYPAAAEPLVVLVRTALDGPVVARERVTLPDMAELISEFWRDGCLRQGQPDVPLEGLAVRILPKFKREDKGRCAGFDLEVTHPDGRTVRRAYSIYSLRAVASRVAQQLRDSGLIEAGAKFFYGVGVEPQSRLGAAAPSGILLEVAEKRTPLTYRRVALQPLLERAERRDLDDDSLFPVFYTRAALAKAERFARRGAAADPPAESGGVLVGSLCSSPCGEFFAVVTDVLEAVECEETTFSLSYSDRTWGRIQAILRARQAAHPARAERMLGQTHGHNFLPHDKTCPECEKQATCPLTSVFLSQDDQNWSRAVFHQQPWQLCHIYGLSARREPVQTLYGVQDGRLQARGYYVIPDFHPEPCEDPSASAKPDADPGKEP